jgi:hypothetical protein
METRGYKEIGGGGLNFFFKLIVLIHSSYVCQQTSCIAAID